MYIAFNCFSKLYGSLFLLNFIFCNPHFLDIASQVYGLENGKVLKVKIPRFDQNGFVSWEVHAESVKPLGNETYFATEPTLFIYSDQKLESKALSQSGRFSLSAQEATGEGTFEVNGSGFFAKGIDWDWRNAVPDGKNRMSFSSESTVIFERGLNNFFANHKKDELVEIDACNDKEQDTNSSTLVPTIANAHSLEFLQVEAGKHRFSLDGNVSIEGKNLFLTCEKMEVIFSSESNSSKNNFIGAISSIKAVGNIILTQFGRKCFAQQMIMDVREGIVLLTGTPARVVDDEWGEASGSRIILERGKRIAKVLGEKNQRSRLELPALPNFGFPKDINKSQKK